MKGKITPQVQKEELEYCRSRLRIHDLFFDTDEVIGRCREAHLNGIRSLIGVILKSRGYSYAKIGAIMNRDHATALHLVNNYGTKEKGRLPNYHKIKKLLLINDSKEEIILQIEAHIKEIEKLQKYLEKKG